MIGVAQATAFLLVAIFFSRGAVSRFVCAALRGDHFFPRLRGGVGFVHLLAGADAAAGVPRTFLFASPAIMLSGFATPVENIPQWLQIATLATP